MAATLTTAIAYRTVLRRWCIYHKRVTVLLLLLITGCAQAEHHSSGNDALVSGFSSERLERIDARMNEAIDDGIMVGGEGLIMRDGELVYRKQWGLADRESSAPIQDDALYRIYSMSKPITAVALLMLYEEGLFLLEDPIANYLPELADLELFAVDENGEVALKAPARQPTIRDLLRHTAGFSYGIFSDTPVDKTYRDAELLQAPTLEEFTRRLGQLPLLLEPGSRWHYSVSVDVQGRLVEVISGMSFGEFLQQKIFEPLGMEDTFFLIPDEKRDRLTTMYSPTGTKLDWNSPWQGRTGPGLELADPELTRGYLEGHLFESGGGGLISTTDDYLKFAMMLARGGELNGVRLLGPRTIKHMQENHISNIDNSGLFNLDEFGLGVGVVGNPGGKSGELGPSGAYGWGGAAGTNFWIDPESGIIGIFMVQSLPHDTPLARKFKILTYQALID